MNLYYVEAVELKTDRKGEKQEVKNTHAVIARDEIHLNERCKTLFFSFESPTMSHQLNSDWDCISK